MQRQAGNKAVGAVLARQVKHESLSDVATPENRRLAAIIDALVELRLDDAGLVRMRQEAVARLAGTGANAGNARDWEVVRAIDYIAASRNPRGIVPRATAPADRAATARLAVERFIVLHGSAKRGFKRLEAMTDPELIRQTRLVKAEMDVFAEDFKRQAREAWKRMLRASLVQIDRVIAGYGLPVSTFRHVAGEVARGVTDPQAAGEIVLKAAANSDGADAPAYVDTRASLAQAVRGLKARQHEHDTRVAAYNDLLNPQLGAGSGSKAEPVSQAELSKAAADVSVSDKRLAEAWAHAEKDHPVIAAYRRGKPLSKIDLETLDSDKGEQQMRPVLVRLLTMRADIARAWGRLAGDKGLELTLPAVVALTRANMFIVPGSVQAAVVDDLVEAEKDKRDDSLLTLAAFVVAVISLIPSGGASVGLLSVGLAGASSLRKLSEYDMLRTFANTALDKADALSDVEPSLMGLAWDLLSTIPDVVPFFRLLRGADVNRLLKAADELRELAAAGENTAAAASSLTKLARQHGYDGELGHDVLQATRPRTTTAAKPRTTGGKAKQRMEPEDAGKGAPKKRATAQPDDRPPIADPLQGQGVPAFTAVTYRSATELRAGIRPVIRTLKHGATLNPELEQLVQAIKAGLVPGNRELLDQLPRVYTKLRDPAFVEEAMVRLWMDAGRRRITVRQALEEHVATHGGPIQDVTKLLDDPEEFRQLLAKGPIRDLEFAEDIHGAHSHMFQEYLVDQALGSDGAGARFRRLIASAGDEPAIAGKKLWAKVWDALFDEADVGHINRADDLGRILQEHVGLPRVDRHLLPPAARPPAPKPSKVRRPAKRTSAKETTEQDRQLTSGKDRQERGAPPATRPEPPIPRRLTLGFANRGEVFNEVERRLSTLASSRPPGWPRVHEALQRVRQPLRDEILARLEKVMSALQDPAGYANVLADAWRLVRNGSVADINAALRYMATANGLDVVEINRLVPPRWFFNDFVSKRASWIDHYFKGDDHGEMTHLLQDLVVDRALGGNGRSGEFRAVLGQATEKVERYLPNTGPDATLVPSPFAEVANVAFIDEENHVRVGDYVWRFTYDLFYGSAVRRMSPRLPQPEVVKPALAFLDLE